MLTSIGRLGIESSGEGTGPTWRAATLAGSGSGEKQMAPFRKRRKKL